MGGHMQQSSAAVYDHTGSLGEAGDAAMSRWLQSAGLQHLASNGFDQRLLPNLLAQGYGAQSLEEKQKVFRMLRSMNLGNEGGLDTLNPPVANIDGFLSPEMRGDFGAGLLDLHALDDNELLSEHTLAETFETSPFMPISERGFENSFDAGSSSGKQQMGQMDINSFRSSAMDREVNGREGNLAKIRVVVRKRPLNKKELARKEDDIVTIDSKAFSLTVHETKLKVDLTAYVEKSEFTFDSVLDEYVTNEEVYRCTVEPIIPTLFRRTKATCFAYGQTGSGKTYTMQPLPLKASEDILGRMNQAVYRNQGFHLWLSFFEIYGGKLYDLLSDRRKLCMREDGRQQVCIVGLQEFEVSDVQVVKDYIEKGNASRSTGSTGANEESSRSHAILQLVIKKHNNGNEMKGAKTVGKMSFIDLAGSERGADTTDNDRQTRMEGAEINKSLLALKECIRALDNDQIHIPFRGSKLTEVLRDSFVGDSRTVMISCISPNAGSCEHTLNTLRYADRVKGLSKSNSKKDQTVSNLAPPQKDSPPSGPVASVDSSDYNQEASVTYNIRKPVEIPSFYGQNGDLDAHSSNLVSNFSLNTRNETGMTSNPLEKDRANLREKFSGSQKLSLVGVKSNDMHDVVSPTSRKISREQKPEKQMYWQSKEDVKPDASYAVYSRQQPYTDESASNAASLRPKETEYDGHINAILEQEEALVAAHRKEIEVTMELVRGGLWRMRMQSSRVGMGMRMGMGMQLASGSYTYRFSFLTPFTHSCVSKRAFLLRSKLKPSLSMLVPHARNNNSIDVDNLSVFRFTLGIVGLDESYLPRIIGILSGFLLVLNHVFTQTSVTAAQLRTEFVGLFLAVIAISIPYVGKRLKGVSVARPKILPVDCREVFLIAEYLSDVDKEDLAWGSYAVLRNTVSRSLLIYHSELLCARGCWDIPAEASKDDIFTMLECEIDQLGLSHVTKTLYFPNYVDRQGLGRLTKGAASLLVQPFNWRVSSNDNTMHSGGFILLLSSTPQAYGDKERAWVAALANKFKNIHCTMKK